jgi:hypothetical protein
LIFKKTDVIKKIAVFIFVVITLNTLAQFPPPVGYAGSTAIYKDSSVFVAWATHCTITRGYMDISNPSLGYASAGDNTSALGIAGTGGVVSLGDAGEAIVQFSRPLFNGTGWDFAVFENSFSNSFLELAFVEVSSDGQNYFRFAATSNTAFDVQKNSYDTLDATQINNLAGKYRALYGTPFDLEELAGTAGLDVNNITHIKIIDVVGCIQPAYARYDAQGNIINDPWPTDFAQGGFDLDAVGAIHQLPLGINDKENVNLQVYPNPANKHQKIRIAYKAWGNTEIVLKNYAGKDVFNKTMDFSNNWQQHDIELPNDISSGIYFLSVKNENGIAMQKIIISE